MVKYKIIILTRAENDLDQIYKYIAYEELAPISAKKITDKIWDAIFTLETFPYSHQEVLLGKFAEKGYKQLIVDNYKIVFKIDKTEKKVYVYTVLHHSINN